MRNDYRVIIGSATALIVLGTATGIFLRSSDGSIAVAESAYAGRSSQSGAGSGSGEGGGGSSQSIEPNAGGTSSTGTPAPDGGGPADGSGAATTAGGVKSGGGLGARSGSNTSASSGTAGTSGSSSTPGTSTSGGSTTVSSADLTDGTRKRRAEAITTSILIDTTTPQYAFAQNYHDGFGIVAGRVGFASSTGDLLQMVQNYTSAAPGNGLAKYTGALQNVNGTDATTGLSGFEAAFVAEDSSSNRNAFRKAQDDLADVMYFNPAMDIARQHNVTTALGQAFFYETAIEFGIPTADGLASMADETASKMSGDVKGNEKAWLSAFLDVRLAHMLNPTSGELHQTASESRDRINALRSILSTGNMALDGPLSWTVHGNKFTVA